MSDTPILGLGKRARDFAAENQTFTRDQIQFLGEQKSLVGLQLTNCGLTDADAELLSDLPAIKSFSLGHNPLTDAALKHLAKASKLTFLDLRATHIAGDGLRYFAGHKTLDCLYLDDTPLTDVAIPYLLEVPKLSTLRAERTMLSREGVMRLANHPRVRLIIEDRSLRSDFAAEQRRLARQGPGHTTPSEADRAGAEKVLREFAEEMLAWEESYFETLSTDGHAFDDDAKKRCRTIFEKYCTDKPRKEGRPNALLCDSPSSYRNFKVRNADQISDGRIQLYVGPERHGWRYFVIKTPQGWRVDHREMNISGWTPQPL